MTELNSATTARSYDNSTAEHARRCAVIAGGVNSNVRLVGTPVPLTFDRGAGALLWDVDGNEYVDYAGGMGPMILGHCHPVVVAAVQESLSGGQLFAGQNRYEAELAELVVGVLPWIESIRVGLSGTELALLAVRIARAATGRRRAVRFVGHYHGWLDPLFIDGAATPEPLGDVPLTPGQSAAAASDVLVCEWNDLDQVAQALAIGDVACVVMEPVMCNTGLIAPAPGYLDGVRSLCAEHGALLVIDEVITGFRFGLTGAQGYLGINGDISIYAKAIASGFPLAVLGATTELLAQVGRGEVNHSGTYNAGVSSLAASVATLRYLRDADPYPQLERTTRRLVEGLRQAGDRSGTPLAVDHVTGSALQVRFGADRPMRSRADFAANSDRVLLTRFLDQLQALGVRPTSRGLFFVSAAHDDATVDRTLAAVDEALRRI
jgi:glutamate-1-semialdehyde 2,1-aminomutase